MKKNTFCSNQEWGKASFFARCFKHVSNFSYKKSIKIIASYYRRSDHHIRSIYSDLLSPWLKKAKEDKSSPTISDRITEMERQEQEQAILQAEKKKLETPSFEPQYRKNEDMAQSYRTDQPQDQPEDRKSWLEQRSFERPHPREINAAVSKMSGLSDYEKTEYIKSLSDKERNELRRSDDLASEDRDRLGRYRRDEVYKIKPGNREGEYRQAA
jgi:hypothetical protein